ncbi:hypothetical protein [Sediminibacillus albus]|uniref:2TM domain-containing protein n=1 Tax=Sediminibacillus albus TaxID=407036 RepID=A0A1G8YB63_9BACI|nr:hypothetical protein [Sediminibacillus albus]SDJ99927.1 hypothetical protein SAMN05216243_1509 [Sediminibacillus albus]
MNFIAWMIVACEIAFWVVILGGLITRYVFKKEKAGLILLALTPVIDVILMFLASYDLYNGATATTAHGIAAVYIGISIAFGKNMIEWADHRFQYYIMRQGPKPMKKYGYAYAKHYAKGWIRHVVAYVIGAGILAISIYIINDYQRTESFIQLIKLWAVVVGIDALITISYFIWPKPVKQQN